MIYAQNNPMFCKKRFYYMASAGLLERLLYIVFGATDMIIAGYFFGIAGVSAVTVAIPLGAMFNFIIMVFVNGCRIVYTEEVGRYDQSKANQYFSTSLTLASAITIISLLFMVFAGSSYFSIFNISGETLNLTLDYLKYYKYAYVVMPFTNFISQMVYCDGDIKLNALGNLFYLVGNVVLSIFGAMFMGMAGIGLATLVSSLGALIINSLHFLKKSCLLRYRFHFSLREQIKLIRYSFIDSSYFLFYSINGLVVNTFIISRFGSDYMAINSVILQAVGLSGMFASTSEAMMPILNTYRGENNPDGVRKLFNVTLRYTIIIGFIFTAIVFLLAPFFPKIFSLAVPELSGACVNGVRIISPTFIFLSIMTVLPMYYNASGYVIMSTVIARVKDSIFYILFFVLCGSLFGVNGMWIGTMICPIAAFLFALLLVKLRFKNDPFLLKANEDGRHIRSWDLELSPESIIELRDQVEAFLNENSVSKHAVNRAAILVEELYMLVLEKNKNGKKLTAELTVFSSDDIELIFRYDGEIIDLVDTDTAPDSLRGYVLSCFEDKIDLKNNATSVSFNRNRFVFKNGRDESLTKRTQEL